MGQAFSLIKQISVPILPRFLFASQPTIMGKTNADIVEKIECFYSR